jgi:hypothetical protein
VQEVIMLFPKTKHAVMLAATLLSACQTGTRTPDRKAIVQTSLCDLRNTPERFGGKTIKVDGWVYTDPERFGLSDGACAVGLIWPDARPSDKQTRQFEALLEASRKGGFNSDEQVFVSLVGRFLTVETKIGSDVWTPGSGPGQSPTVLLINEAECATVAPRTSNTMDKAYARCKSS